MQTRDYELARNVAGLSQLFGAIFCVLGLWIVIELGSFGLISLAGSAPSLAGGMLLIVAGRILRIVADHSNASAEALQILQRIEKNPVE